MVNATEKSEVTMVLSKTSLDTLIDLVEIRLGYAEVYDHEDARELSALEECRNELEAMRDVGETKKASTFTAANGRQNPPTRAARH